MGAEAFGLDEKENDEKDGGKEKDVKDIKLQAANLEKNRKVYLVSALCSWDSIDLTILKSDRRS